MEIRPWRYVAFDVPPPTYGELTDLYNEALAKNYRLRCENERLHFEIKRLEERIK